METKDLAITTKNKQKIQLVNGAFTPSEASEVIIALIDEKINFHKVKKIQLWEGNHNCETSQLDSRIRELQEEKRKVTEFIAHTKDLGRNLKVNGFLEMTVTD